jgi:hypothetical protein
MFELPVEELDVLGEFWLERIGRSRSALRSWRTDETACGAANNGLASYHTTNVAAITKARQKVDIRCKIECVDLVMTWISRGLRMICSYLLG